MGSERQPPAEWSLAGRALRALLVYPVLLVVPWVVIARLSATASDDDLTAGVQAAFYGIPLGALVSLGASLATCLRGPLELQHRVALALLAVIGAGAAFICGAALWIGIADIDCAGRYECPL